MAHELRSPVTMDEWEAYHSIRERVLWEARGRFGEYDRSHPDEHRDGHHPLLLLFRNDPIGVVRVDVSGKTAFIRRVAIREELQRMGHGRQLISMVEQFARAHGCTEARSHVDSDAVRFYREVGYCESGPAQTDARVPMRKALL